MDAAWAAQPDLLVALEGEVGRQLSQVEGGVPHALDDLVVWVCQRFLALLIEAHACNTDANE